MSRNPYAAERAVRLLLMVNDARRIHYVKRSPDSEKVLAAAEAALDAYDSDRYYSRQRPQS